MWTKSWASSQWCRLKEVLRQFFLPDLPRRGDRGWNGWCWGRWGLGWKVPVGEENARVDLDQRSMQPSIFALIVANSEAEVRTGQACRASLPGILQTSTILQTPRGKAGTYYFHSHWWGLLPLISSSGFWTYVNFQHPQQFLQQGIVHANYTASEEHFPFEPDSL